MQKILLLICLMCSLGCMAQEQNDSVKIYSSICTEKMEGNPDYDNGEQAYSVDFRTKDGKKAKSVVAALNLLSLEGWQIETSFTNAIILSKKVSRKEAEEKAAKGIKE